MLNMHELNVFVEAAQTENFSVAAHRLYLSQPAVSLQVRNLEKQLGVELFRRHGRNVVLSDAGKVLLPMAQQILLQAKHIEEVMWGLQGMVIGELGISCSTTVGKYLLPRLIAGFRGHYPEVQVAVHVTGRRTAMDALLEGSADIAVVSSHVVHRDLEYQPFIEDQVVLIVPCDHPWADGRVIKAENLLECDFIMREPTAGSYEVLAEGLSDRGLNISDLRVVMTLGNAEAIEMSVEAGLGVAFVSRFVANRGLMLGRIAEVTVEGMSLARVIYMVRHVRRAATPPQQAFWDFAFDPANEELRQLPVMSAGPNPNR
jgi:LysR family transcriptional regulator, transcriptional activator of the cysJI operon